MSERDFADLALSRDMVLWEIDKWLWRDWSPQWNDARHVTKVQETVS